VIKDIDQQKGFIMNIKDHYELIAKYPKGNITKK